MKKIFIIIFALLFFTASFSFPDDVTEIYFLKSGGGGGGSTITSPLEIEGSTTVIDFIDTDGVDSDVNASISGQLTDTGSGTEDMDLDFQTMVNGLARTYLSVDADSKTVLSSPASINYYFQVSSSGVSSVRASTINTIMNDDLAAGDFFNIYPLDISKELTDTNGQQSLIDATCEVAQSGTAAFDGFYLDITGTSWGDGTTGDGNNLLNLKVDTVQMLELNTDGDLSIAGDFSPSGTINTNGPFTMAEDGGVQTHTTKSVTASSSVDESYWLQMDGFNAAGVLGTGDGANSVTGVGFQVGDEVDDYNAVFNIKGDADSDAAETDYSTFSIQMVGVANPANSYWLLTSTDSRPLTMLGSWQTTTSKFSGLISGGPGLIREGATDVNPNILPINTDEDTGIGHPAPIDDDSISIIAGANEGIRIIEYNDGASKTVNIINSTQNDTVTNATTAGDTSLTKAGENFLTSTAVGDYVIIYSGSTAADYGVYLIASRTDTIITLDSACSGSDSDVDFIVIDSSASVFEEGGSIYLPGYTRHIAMPASTSQVGATAPTATTVGTSRGLGFDADGELVFFDTVIPEDWNGTSDMNIEIYWSAENGDAVADTEQVIWDTEYRSVAEGEAVDNGTLVNVACTHTQSGGGTDKELYETTCTIDYDDANQPLTAGDTLFIKLNRDVTAEAGNTYSGLAILQRYEIKYTSNALPYE